MKRLLTISILLLGVILLFAQQKNYNVYSIAFYNIENLFDTEDDPDNNGDNEFLPGSTYNWTQDKYEKKLDNIARVISRLGRDYCPMGPAVIGISEVENRKVLEDLVKRPAIAAMGLEIVHQESPDRRGIDVALLYNPRLFQMTGYFASPYYNEQNPEYVSRDQLWVSGLLAGEKIHVSVNHWPSRYGGAKSSSLREAAAANVKAVVDSLYQDSPDARIFIMGDLNDDPVDRSTRIVLDAKRVSGDVKTGGLFNPMWRLYSQGIGSLAYQGKWSLFDQIIISYPLLGSDYSQLRFWRAEVFNKDFLIQKEGPDKGYPHRTFSNNTFINGYSDHFPVIVYLVREE
ncbi:endonuclease/exonuclease/phosphatase family protein [Proteiniphilum sp. UBA5384]|uniref:endonuclease/exonuclease/phosphatase family protein n=1 Tax=Proteiniphilum sp. UBA5384 TaxID=1947279 RepID=UPI0025F9D30F|nr:endonuclease/exonuclease/phosphatase family protein [Proteiniphilum sp. UBA5384]